MSRSTRRTSVIINLLKVPNGYEIENDQKGTTIQIPKSYLTQPKVKQKIYQDEQEFNQPKKLKKLEKLALANQDHQQYESLQGQTQNSPNQASSNRLQLKQQHPTPITLPFIQTQQQVEQAVRSRQPQEYTLLIPSCSYWFTLDSIHQYEKDALPEYFTGNKPSKSVEIYKRQRNFIVQLYRSNPQVYLTATTCRRALSGDACGISRIHAFLQHWGIINFNVDPETCPNKVFPFPQVNSKVFEKTQQDELDEGEDLTSSERIMVTSLKILSKNYRPTCDFCGIICGLAWFQQKQLGLINKDIKELVLCVKCYTSGNFPQILSQEDFVRNSIEQQFEKTDLIQKLQKGERTFLFSSEETFYLLSAIEENPDIHWEDIVTKMNSLFNTKRTQEELVLHYLQLPFKNLDSLQKYVNVNDQSDFQGCKEMLQRLSLAEPNLYSDHSNALTFHISLFRKLLNKYQKKEPQPQKAEEQLKCEEEKEIPKNEQILEEIGEQTYGVKQLENQVEEQVDEALQKMENMSEMEIESILKMKDETVERAKVLQQKEEDKITEYMNLVISIQMEKLELKLGYLEEYEKLILYEKRQLEFLQRMSLADRLQVVHRRLQN